MKKYLLLVSWLAFAGCVQDRGWDITVKGTASFSEANGVVYLEQLDSRNRVYGAKREVSVGEDGAFEEVINVIEPGYFRLNFYDLQQVNFIADRSDLEINVDGNSQPVIFEVKGSPDADLIDRVQVLMQEVANSPRAQELNNSFGEATKNDDKAHVEKIREEYMDLIHQGRGKVADLLRGQGPSIAVIKLLSSGELLNYDSYADLYTHVVDELKAEWPNYTVTQDFIAFVEKSKAVSVGQPAPKIALPNPDGQIIKLSSFRGKYVLIDFWAKWCGPCRKENPNVVRAYKQYHDKGFEVFGVSLDTKKNEWLQAIEEDGLVWTHVSDLKSFDSQVVQDYQVNGIPFSILVDPDGIIIGKGLRGVKLDEKLEEILGSS